MSRCVIDVQPELRPFRHGNHEKKTLTHSFKYMLSLQTVCCAPFYCDGELLGCEGLSYWLSVGLSGFCPTGGLWGCQDFIALVDYGAVRILSHWWTSCWAVRVLSYWWTMGLSVFCHAGGLWGTHLGHYMPAIQ